MQSCSSKRAFSSFRSTECSCHQKCRKTPNTWWTRDEWTRRRGCERSVFLCVWERETVNNRASAGCCCQGDSLSSFSSLTLSPHHFLLFTFCVFSVAAISHLLMFCRAICARLSVGSRRLRNLRSARAQLARSYLHLDYSWPSCWRHARALLAVNHSVQQNSDSLCRTVLSIRKSLFHSRLGWFRKLEDMEELFIYLFFLFPTTAMKESN